MKTGGTSRATETSPLPLIEKCEKQSGIMEVSVKNHTDVLIVHTQICDGAPQICLMADANLIFASPVAQTLRNGG